MTIGDIYFNVLSVIVLLSTFVIRKSYNRSTVISVPPSWFSLLLAIGAVYCFATVPVPWGTWSDRHGYASYVISARHGVHSFAIENSDYLFAQWIIWTSKIVDYKGWFYLTAAVYVGNYYIAAWRFARRYSFVLFLMMLACFQYFSYATNTIRAGFAGSFVILGLSFCNDYRKMAICLLIALFCHKSMMIPIAAIILAYNIRKTNWYIWVWLACIVVSYIVGESIQERASFLITENRTGYLTVDAAHTDYKIGFRWDFLLYSTLPVLLGYYYIYKLNFKNEFYEFLYRMYLTANGFWILVIRANYTDRFAYLSWFVFPILLVYPLLSKQLYRDAEYQARNVNLVLIGEFAFTFFMYLRDGGTLFGVRLF